MKIIQTLKKQYVIVNKNGYPDLGTLSEFRSISIEYFLNGSTLTWKECLKLGYKCHKVNIEFTIIK